LNNFLVSITRGFSPFVISDVEFFPEIDKFLRDSFDEFCRWDARFGWLLLHFLAVLIDTGQKENFLSLEPVIARDDIGQHFFVSMTDMWRRIRVIDRRSDEKFLRHCGSEILRAPAAARNRQL